MSAETRPKKLPVDHLADFLGVSRTTCRDWVARGHARQGLGSGTDAQKQFAEIYDRFCEVMAEQPTTQLFNISNNPKSSSQFNAVKLLLAKIDPAEWGENQASTRPESNTGIADIPRDVIDDLNEAELLQLEQLQSTIAEAMEASAAIIRTAKARVAQRAAANDGEVEH
jgi:hypothetical protein